MSEFTLYDEFLAWKDGLWVQYQANPDDEVLSKAWNKTTYFRMDRHKAERTSEKTFEVLENLWLKDQNTAPKLFAWASRLRDPNTAMSLAYTGWRLSVGRIPSFEGTYFTANWKAFGPKFKVFGNLVFEACSARFWEIFGRDSRTPIKQEPVPVTPWVPPAVPSGLIPMSAARWELYEAVAGADRAANALGASMAKAVEMLGRKVTPRNTDAANALVVRAVLKRMGKILETYSKWGAMDSEPEAHVIDVVEGYLKLYLPRWEFPKTYDALDRSNL